VAKKFGKKKQPAQLGDLFGAPPPPPRSAPPASSTPLSDYLSTQGLPGVDEGYVVLPRSLAEGMSLPWQQQMAGLLSQFHQQHRSLNWPIYRAVPSRYEKLTDLDEEQLAEVGYLVEIDADGDMVYRERSGRKVEEPESTTVLVPCLDPIPPRAQAPGKQDQPAQQPDAPRAAPMNIPPAPVWRTTPAPPSREVPPLPEPPKKLAEPRTPPVRDPQAWRTMEAREEQQARLTEPLPPQPQPTPAAGIPIAPRADQAEPTPPRGTPAQPSNREWFEENAPAQDFGPTGQPTELPYRYRP